VPAYRIDTALVFTLGWRKVGRAHKLRNAKWLLKEPFQSLNPMQHAAT
jgi:hypothetical protein